MVFKETVDLYYESNEFFSRKEIGNSSSEIKKYRRKVNYNCGVTEHYEGSRMFRYKELENILGKGSHVDSFLVKCMKNGNQIQEVLSNGIMNVYSYDTHKLVTSFAPTPDRIITLYHSVGENPPMNLIKQSECNYKMGYNEIMNYQWIAEKRHTRTLMKNILMCLFVYSLTKFML